MKIKDITTLKRLQAKEPLWSSLVNENNEADRPDWHADVLADRKTKIEDGTANFISLDVLRVYRN